jgi:hypothetical protein
VHITPEIPVAPQVKLALSRRVRQARQHNIIERADVERGEVAIYTLADPRDVRVASYVGQTRNPEARFAQHVNAARLWLPDERPWWIRPRELRPLYSWIRELYADDGRLPMLVVAGWVDADRARGDERKIVRDLLADGAALLNAEAEIMKVRGRYAAWAESQPVEVSTSEVHAI